MILVKNILKTFLFYCLLALYAIFIPFIFVKCSKLADDPYIVVDDEEDSDEEKLAECQAQTFLTADCVALIQAEDERLAAEDGAITTAYETADTAMDCMTGKIAAETTSTSTATTTATGTSTATVTTTVTVTYCLDDTDAQAIIDGYEACTTSDTAKDNNECESIEEDYSDLVTDCNLTTTDLPEDFCNTLIDFENEPKEDKITTE